MVATLALFGRDELAASAQATQPTSYPHRIEMPTESGERIVFEYEFIDSDEKAIFHRAAVVTVGPDGRQYWLDAGDGDIKALDSNNELLFSMGGVGQAPGRWTDGEIVIPTVSPGGDVYVWDPPRNLFLVFDADGSYKSSVELGHKLQIDKIVWVTDDEMIVGGLSFEEGYHEYFAHRLRIDTDGGTSTLHHIGSFIETPVMSPGLYYMLAPGLLATDIDGGLLYSARTRHRVEKYSPDGMLLWQINDPAVLPNAANDLATTPEGRVRVKPHAVAQTLFAMDEWIVHQVLRTDLMKLPSRPAGMVGEDALDMSSILVVRTLELIDRSAPNTHRLVAHTEGNATDVRFMTRDAEGRLYGVVDFAGQDPVRGVLSVQEK